MLELCDKVFKISFERRDESMYRSKLIKLANYKDFEIEEEMYGGSLKSEEIEEELQKKAKANLITKEAETVKKGDVVVLSLQSDFEKFNRKDLPLNVGLGMFDAELEEKIVGMKKYESKTLQLNKGKIKVDISNITRRSIPEITDEFIKSLNIDGVVTVDEYKNKLIQDDLREKKMETIPFQAMGYLVENSEFNIIEKDLEEMAEGQFKSLEVEAKIINKPVEELIKEIYGIAVDELIAWFRQEAELNLKQILIGINFAEKNNGMLTDEAYEKEIEENAAKMDLSVEDTKKIFPVKLFYGNWYPLQAMEEIYAYYQEQFK